VNLPLLAPHAQLAWRDSNHLILEDPAAPQTQVLVGNATPATARWLRSCDGTHTLGDLLASAAAVGIDPTSAEALLGTLVQTGLLTLEAAVSTLAADWDPDAKSALRHDLDAIALAGSNAAAALHRRQEHRIIIEGTNRVAHALVDVLAAAHIGDVQVLAKRTTRRSVTLRDVGAFGPDPADVGFAPSLAMKRHIERRARARHGTHVRPLVIACDSHLDPADEITYQQAATPYLRMLVTSRYATIGPLTLPGSSVCWSCIAMHRTDLDPYWPHLLAQFEHHRRQLAPIDSAFAMWVASEAVAHLLRVIDHDDPSTLANTTLHFDRNEMVIRRRHWTVHPDCPCQWRQAA
jgi:hypothetical protein